MKKEDEKTTPSKTPTKRKKRRVRLLWILGILIAIRLALPYIILYYANDKLSKLDGYYGHIDDIDLALIRGAYTIDSIYIDKTNDDGKKIAEFFSCKEIDLSVEWAAIFEGKIVGEVEFDQPILKYTVDKTIGKNAEKDSTNFLQLVKDFIPLNINRFATNEGQIHFIDAGSSPKVDLPLTELELEGRGLTNKPEDGEILPASIELFAKLFDGDVNVNVKLDPLNENPTFDLNGKLTQTQLVHLNEFFQAYANFDLKAGNMELFTEIAAKDGEFTGYVKPLVRDLDIVQFNKEEGNIPQIIWEAFIGATAEIFQNQFKSQLGSKVEIKGKFSNPKVAVLDAIISMLKNAFIKALEPSIENEINLAAVEKDEKPEKEGLLKRLFSKDDEKSNEKKENHDTRKSRKKDERKKEKESK